jgi:hypothetical protein
LDNNKVYDSLVITNNVNSDKLDVTEQSEIVVSPTVTTMYTLTASNMGSTDTETVIVTIGEVGNEIVVYDWDGEVLRADQSLPSFRPPMENDNWKEPINYAQGTLHFRVVVRNMPQPKEMQLQYCVWQDGFSAEQCAVKGRLTGNPGTELTWADTVEGMWTRPGTAKINWAEPRFRDGVAINNKGGKLVHKAAEDGQEILTEWYPLDWHFMVVVVEQGKAFSGWENYLP